MGSYVAMLDESEEVLPEVEESEETVPDTASGSGEGASQCPSSGAGQLIIFFTEISLPCLYQNI